MRHLAILSLLFSAAQSYGDRLEGVVTEVVSGDRLVLTVKGTKKKHHIKLAGIVAPVPGQPFFENSRGSLRRLTDKRVINVDWDRVEARCKRRVEQCPKIGRVLVGSKDLSLIQVKAGLAWHDVRRLEDQTTPDRTLYSEAEESAKNYRRGLWRAKNPIAPWLFKKKLD